MVFKHKHITSWTEHSLLHLLQCVLPVVMSAGLKNYELNTVRILDTSIFNLIVACPIIGRPTHVSATASRTDDTHDHRQKRKHMQLLLMTDVPSS